jgi:tRNA-dihydrouridine synthase 3
VIPQKFNNRPPKYKGRDELETLLSSPSASDGVKISEIPLGRIPDNLKFLPKHKANAI